MPDRRRAVVITGASSGVGRATAHAFARRGADLVLAARGREALEDTAHEVEALGGRARVVPTDVRDAAAVAALAEAAGQACGGIEVWVNNAGVGVVGRFWEVSLELHRAVIETNLMGYVHGAYAAIPWFLRQGRGVLVNNVSIGGFIPAPYAAAYSAAKFGARAFSDSLHHELRDRRHIHVCAIYPFFLDTPGIYHGANRTGRALTAPPMLDRPEHIAEVIVRLTRHPRRETVIGLPAKLARWQHDMTPGLVQWVGRRGMDGYLQMAEPAPLDNGNLLTPSGPPMAVHGGWRRPAARKGAAAIAGLAALGLATGLALRARRAV